MTASPLRIALFTLESTASAEAVLEFARAQRARLALVGLSDPYRATAGGALGQLRAHLARSGPRMLPYLAVNFTLPALLAPLRRLARRDTLRGFCRAAGVPVLTVPDVNGAEIAAALRAARADLIVSFHFDQIFGAATLALAPRGGINVHPSLLPHHRGPMPTFWALAERPRRTGVTVHRLVPRIDAGEILAQAAEDLPDGVSASTAARLLHRRGVALASEAVMAIEAGDAAGRAAAVLPYCPFPDAARLRAAAREGVRLVDPSDLVAAWRAPV